MSVSKSEKKSESSKGKTAKTPSQKEDATKTPGNWPVGRGKRKPDTAPDDDKKSYGEKNTSYTRYRV
jgi:hypothetical protein